MDVAVVIPVYNGACWLPATLATVFAQTHPPAAVCVVDDGSTDDSATLAATFPGVVVRRNPAKGVGAARQFGLQHTTAPLVAFLDQDDLWHPSHLLTLVDTLHAHPACPAAVALACSFRGDRPPPPPPAGPAKVIDPWATFPFNHISSASAVLIRRDCLTAVGGWPTRYDGADDVYTWLRLSVTEPLRLSGATTLGYRQHDDSLSTTLRVGRLGHYLAVLQAAVTDALAHRLAVRPDDAAHLRRRLAVAAVRAEFLQTLTGPAPSQAEALARKFERLLKQEGNEFTRAAMPSLRWFLTPSLIVAGPDGRQTLRDVIECWTGVPAVATHLRQLLQDVEAMSHV